MYIDKINCVFKYLFSNFRLLQITWSFALTIGLQMPHISKLKDFNGPEILLQFFLTVHHHVLLRQSKVPKFYIPQIFRCLILFAYLWSPPNYGLNSELSLFYMFVKEIFENILLNFVLIYYRSFASS